MGYIHLYVGDGRGKTTAAIGLAIRAAGHHKNVLIARFLKANDSGELAVLSETTHIDIVPNPKQLGFIFTMTETEKRDATVYYTKMFQDAVNAVQARHYDVLILDEIIDACNMGMVEYDTLYSFLGNRPDKLEVLLTGRDPSITLTDIADYISEIKKIKHPYDNGIGARKGIEY